MRKGNQWPRQQDRKPNVNDNPRLGIRYRGAPETVPLGR